MTKYVSINSHTIKANAKNGTEDPPIRIARSRSDRKPTYASAIEIVGKAQLVYTPEKPFMKCGARLVLVADDVKIVR